MVAIFRPYGEVVSKPFEVERTVSGIRSLIIRKGIDQTYFCYLTFNRPSISFFNDSILYST